MGFVLQDLFQARFQDRRVHLHPHRHLNPKGVIGGVVLLGDYLRFQDTRREGQDLILFNLRIFHDGCAFDIGSRQLQNLPFGLGHGGNPGVIGRLASAEGLFDGVGDDLDLPEGTEGIKQDENQKGNKDTLHGLALLCDVFHAPECE